MIFKTASGLAFAVQFIFLGAYTGVVMNVIGSIRNIVFARLVSKKQIYDARHNLFFRHRGGVGRIDAGGRYRTARHNR